MNKPRSRIFQWWFYGGLLLLLFGIIPISYISISSLRAVNSERTELTEKYARALALTNHLRYYQSHEGELALKYTLTGHPTLLLEITKSREEFSETIAKLKTLDPSPHAKELLNEILQHKYDLVMATNPVFGLNSKDHSVRAIHYYMEKNGKVFNEKITRLIDTFFNYEIARMDKMKRTVNHLTSRLDHALVLTSIFTCAGFLIIVLLLFRLAESGEDYQKTLEQLNLQMEKVAAVRKEVLESVSHDLKNPTASIQLGVQMLKRLLAEKNFDAKVESHLHRLENSSKVMKDLIDDLMDSVKADSGNLELDFEALNPLELVQNAVESLASLAETKKIQLDLVAPSVFHLIRGDEKRLLQVFSNLLGNALKFTTQGGHIKVSFKDESGAVSFSIQDSGPGIEAHHIPQLFNRFWQADKKGKTGTGLGLSIVKSIVDAHGGSIWVESQVGVGSIFTFTTPVYPQDFSTNSFNLERASSH